MRRTKKHRRKREERKEKKEMGIERRKERIKREESRKVEGGGVGSKSCCAPRPHPPPLTGLSRWAANQKLTEYSQQ